MALYHIKAPDGSVHEVAAPDSASPEEVQAFAQRSLAGSHHGQSWAEAVHGGISSFLDGILPGAAGVVSGAARAIAHPTTPIESFRRGRAEAKQHEEGFKRDHPTLGAAAIAAGFAGGLALPVIKVGLGLRAAQATLKGRILNTAANGALFGGAGALASSHADGVGGVARETARGALIGAGTGAVLPIAGRAVTATAAPMTSRLAPVLAPAIDATGRALGGSAGRHLQNRAAVLATLAAEAQASRYISRQMDRAGLDSASLTAELRRRQDLGVPAVPADPLYDLSNAQPFQSSMSWKSYSPARWAGRLFATRARTSRMRGSTLQQSA